jgi:hypothetical protein
LPTGQRGFVAEVEEEHARDVRLARGELERAAVGGGCCCSDVVAVISFPL